MHSIIGPIFMISRAFIFVGTKTKIYQAYKWKASNKSTLQIELITFFND